MRLRFCLSFVAAVGLGYLSLAAAPQEIGVAPSVGAYDLVADWPKLAHPYPRAGYILGSQGGIVTETANRIFLANRGELKLPAQLPARFTGFWGSLVFPKQANANAQNPDLRNCIMIVDADGNLVESWTQWDHVFGEGRGPHSIRISPYDPDRHVWVIDDYHHQIFEFTNDGKSLVRTLGERDAGGSDGTHFRRPTDMDWLPDGTFFVSDGYGNTRVAKFDKNGNFLLDWGTRGTGPGQFNTPHGIAVGLNRRVYVSDRGNKRIQVFDENGKFIAEWPNVMAQTLMTAANGNIWLYDSDRQQYVQYDPDGKELSTFAIPGTFAHQISADPNGVFYAAGSRHGQPLKYRPKPGATPAELMRPIPLKGASLSTANTSVNFSGSWKLAKAEPERANTGGSAPSFGVAAPVLTIAHTADEIAWTNGPVKLVFKMNGGESTNSSYVEQVSGSPARTSIRWKGDKLVLYTKQGLNLDLDTLSLNGNTLTILRDVNTAGGSFVQTLTYTKTP